MLFLCWRRKQTDRPRRDWKFTVQQPIAARAMTQEKNWILSLACSCAQVKLKTFGLHSKSDKFDAQNTPNQFWRVCLRFLWKRDRNSCVFETMDSMVRAIQPALFGVLNQNNLRPVLLWRVFFVRIFYVKTFQGFDDPNLCVWVEIAAWPLLSFTVSAGGTFTQLKSSSWWFSRGKD